MPFPLIISRLRLEVLKSNAACLCISDDLPDLLSRDLWKPTAHKSILCADCRFLNISFGVNFCNIAVRKKNIYVWSLVRIITFVRSINVEICILLKQKMEWMSLDDIEYDNIEDVSVVKDPAIKEIPLFDPTTENGVKVGDT